MQGLPSSRPAGLEADVHFSELIPKKGKKIESFPTCHFFPYAGFRKTLQTVQYIR